MACRRRSHGLPETLCWLEEDSSSETVHEDNSEASKQYFWDKKEAER